MSIYMRRINLSLSVLIICLASALILSTARNAKANFIGECPIMWDNCGSCSEFTFNYFDDRCATAQQTYPTSGGDITQYECCVYAGYNAYCSDLAPDLLMGQRYDLKPFDGMSSAVCAGQHTDVCSRIYEA